MIEKPYLVHWSDDSDHNTETVATLDEAQDEIDRWLDLRRREAETDEGWALDMTGCIAVIVERVVEEEHEAPEGSSFDRCVDYHRERVPDPRDARIAALEGELSALRAQLAAPLRLPSVEEVSARVHDAWMESKRRAGVTSRKLEGGEELMVPFGDLSEQAKELDRATVRAVYAAIGATGESEPAPLRLGRGPTLEEVKTVAAKQSDGLGWWMLNFGGDGIAWDVCSLHVEDGAVLLDSGMSVYGFHDITDAIPLSSSRQPCGVGVKL